MSGDVRRALVLLAAGAVMVGAYVFSFVFAQATPAPHDVPVAIAGPGADAARDRVQRREPEAFDVRVLADAAEARADLRDGEIYAALVIGGRRTRLLTAPALGLEPISAVQARLDRAAGVPPAAAAEQIRPLVADDRRGLALNLVLLPLIILGTFMPLLITVVSPGLVIRERLAVLCGFALLGGCAAAVVARVGLEALPGPTVWLAVLCTLIVLAVTTAITACVGALGPVGVGVGVVLFLVIGNVASGASVPHEMLPGFWREVGPWLPPGAGADALRSVAYFDGAGLGRPLLVLLGFAAIGVAGFLLVGDRRPAARGVPEGPTPDASHGGA